MLILKKLNVDVGTWILNLHVQFQQDAEMCKCILFFLTIIACGLKIYNINKKSFWKDIMIKHLIHGGISLFCLI